MMTVTRSAWAIRVPSGLIGVGWFAGWSDGPHRQGMPIALFETRREARAALFKVKGPAERGRFPSATVARVNISTTTVGR